MSGWAEQEEPLRRRVALKIIKMGMDPREVVAYFEAERRALATMDWDKEVIFFSPFHAGSGKATASLSMPTQPNREETLFGAALKLPADARAAFLECECAGDQTRIL